MSVHPQVAKYLAEVAEIDIPPFEDMTPEWIRSTLTPSPAPHLPAKNIEDRTISVNDSEIGIRIYTPEPNPSATISPFPALVFGSGV